MVLFCNVLPHFSVIHKALSEHSTRSKKIDQIILEIYKSSLSNNDTIGIQVGFGDYAKAQAYKTNVEE